MRRTLLALLTVACLCALYTVAFAAARPTARLTAGTSLHTKTIAKGRKLHPGVTLTAPATIHGQTIKRYQWVRCNIKGRSCTRIKGATRRTYRLTRKDIGHTLIVRMVVGTTIVSSTPTATVGAALAVNTTAPAIADITSGSRGIIRLCRSSIHPPGARRNGAQRSPPRSAAYPSSNALLTS